MSVLSIIAAQNPSFYRALSPILNHLASLPLPIAPLDHYAGLLFLLSQFPNRVIVPTPEIDEVLHTHLDDPSCTQDYRTLFGSVSVVHQPGPVNLDAFAWTKKLFEQTFQVTYGDRSAACELFLQE